jgi:alpha-tubulin suppressor-like RCC1 family protein
LGSDVIALTAGEGHTCALTSGGRVKCWGDNYAGQLGDGTTNDHLTPTNVSGLSKGITDLEAGRDHTCALTGEGGTKCWGYNYEGQLGNGGAGYYMTPVDVVSFHLYLPIISQTLHGRVSHH